MTSSVRAYLAETWEDPSVTSRARIIACVAAFCLHMPLSLVSAYSYGFLILIGAGINAFVLLCVGFALWRLHSMSGQKEVFGRTFTRSHFDYAILFILGVYAFTCFVLVISSFGRFWHQFSQIWWPFLTLTDVFAFAAAWISTRSDGGAVFLS